MKINNKTLATLICTGMLLISIFLTWGVFDLSLTGDNGIFPDKFNVNMPAFNGEKPTNVTINNPLNNIKLGGAVKIEATGWKTNVNLGGVRINTWIFAILAVLAGLCILAVDAGVLKMSMLFPRIILALSTIGIGLFAYVMMVNDGLAAGSIIGLICTIGLLVASFLTTPRTVH